jgi:hypothetical protein
MRHGTLATGFNVWLVYFGGNYMQSTSRRIGPAQRCAAATVLMSVVLVASAFANNPIPQVVGPPVPQAVVPGSGAFTLTVYGANFVSGAVVNWNRSARSTAFISARELKAQILASDVTAATAGYITVTNPPPGGGVSSSSFGLVEVHTPTATIVANMPNVYLRNRTPFFLISADFNNDGILDFASPESETDIEARLGNGDGAFRFGSLATHSYYSGSAIAYGDFNNDGNEDLVFGADPNGPPTQLKLSLGKGDGTFRQGSRFGHFSVYPIQIVIGDFNGDGNLDAVALEGGVYVFLGNGDGTFRRPSFDSNVGGFDAVAADFNGDGILDLALLRETEIQILLGNGDGTFKVRNIPIPNDFGCSFGPSIYVTDFNGDGKADLAYCESDQNNGKLWIMIGKGDGTFKKPVSIPIQNGIYGFSFAVGDFNSDGKTDLLVNYNLTNFQSETDLYLGNGDGTFQHKRVVKLPGNPGYNAEDGIVPADFNSDGLLDFIYQAPGEVDVFAQK